MATKTAPTGMTVTLKLYGEDGRKLLHREVELNPNTTLEEATRLFDLLTVKAVSHKAAREPYATTPPPDLHA